MSCHSDFCLEPSSLVGKKRDGGEGLEAPASSSLRRLLGAVHTVRPVAPAESSLVPDFLFLQPGLSQPSSRTRKGRLAGFHLPPLPFFILSLALN